MTPQALTHAELDELAALEAKATPGEWLQEPWYCEEGGWCAMGPHRECDPDSDDELEETDEPGSPCHKRAQADAAYVRALTAAVPALLASARRLGEVEGQREYSIARADAESVERAKFERWYHELNDAVHAACSDLNEANGIDSVRALRKQLTAANARVAELTQRADAAEAKLSSLTDRITEIADDALGLQVPGTPLHVMLDSLSKAYHDERIAKSAAEAKLAKHAAASDSVRGIAAMAGDIEHYISAHEDTRHDFMRKMAAAIRTLDAPNWVTPEGIRLNPRS